MAAYLDDSPAASRATSPLGRGRSASAAVVSPRSRPPVAPVPLRLTGYLKKLKSEDGGGVLGALRGKFNKRWFAVDEVHANGGGAYELKYWKVSSDAATKLPGFVLGLDAMVGCGEGVGMGPFTNEPHTFHVETASRPDAPARTYVLTAASRDEMRWWIAGLTYYAWMHRRTLQLASEPTPRDAASPRDLPVLPRRNSLPSIDLASPVSSTDESLFGSPDPARPLPAFSPLENPTPSPFSPAFSPERVTVQLRDFEHTSEHNRAAAGLDESIREELEIDHEEHKYDMPSPAPAASSPPPPKSPPLVVRPNAPPAALIATLRPRPVPGELSSPIRFDNPDIETARPLVSPQDSARSPPSAAASARSPPAFIDSARSSGSEDPFSSPHVASSSPLNDLATNRVDEEPEHTLEEPESIYPSLDSLRDHAEHHASAPPQTERSGVEPSPRATHNDSLDFGDSITSPEVEASLSPSAPPQTQRPAIPARPLSLNRLPPISSSSISTVASPATNPHVSLGTLTDSDDDVDPFAVHKPKQAHEDLFSPDLGATTGEASFRVMSSVRELESSEHELEPKETHDEIEEEDEAEVEDDDDDPFGSPKLQPQQVHTLPDPADESGEGEVVEEVAEEQEEAVEGEADHHKDEEEEDAHIQAALVDTPEPSSPLDRIGEESILGDQSLDGADEEILNGSVMFAESMAPEHEQKAVPSSVPQLRATGPPIGRMVLPPLPAQSKVLSPVPSAPVTATAASPIVDSPQAVATVAELGFSTPASPLIFSQPATPILLSSKKVQEPATPPTPLPVIAAAVVTTPVPAPAPIPPPTLAVIPAPSPPQSIALASLPPPAGGLQVSLTLDMNFSVVSAAPGAFVANFTNELCSALDLPPHRAQVVGLTAGSVVVALNILDRVGNGVANEPTPSQAMAALRNQLDDPNSKLKQGRITGQIKQAVVVAGEEKFNEPPLIKAAVPVEPFVAPTPQTKTVVTPAVAPAAGNWQNDLSSLLRADKLPYEDVLTQRHANGHVIAASPVAPLPVTRGPAPITAKPIVSRASLVAPPSPVTQCDQCYSAIHSENVAAATYVWSTHQVLCGRCTTAQLGSYRDVEQVSESLLSYLQHQGDAYCPLHALAAPALPTALPSLNGPVTRGVRSRALRFVGLYEACCETCCKLLCATCRREDGVHGQAVIRSPTVSYVPAYGPPATTHVVREIATAYATHSTALLRALHGQVLPKRAQLVEAEARHATRATELQNEANTIRAETTEHATRAARTVLKRQEPLTLQLSATRQGVVDDVRALEQIEQALLEAQSSSVASISSAAMCSFIGRAPGLLARARTLFPGGASAHGLTAAPAHTPGLPDLLFAVQEAQQQVTADKKEQEDKVQALPALSHGIAAKDRDLASILSSRRGLAAEAAAQAASLDSLYTAAHAEIQEWMTLTEGMSQRIAALKQQCGRCGLSLTPQAANARCAANRTGLHAFGPSAVVINSD